MRAGREERREGGVKEGSRQTREERRERGENVRREEGGREESGKGGRKGKGEKDPFVHILTDDHDCAYPSTTDVDNSSTRVSVLMCYDKCASWFAGCHLVGCCCTLRLCVSMCCRMVSTISSSHHTNSSC